MEVKEILEQFQYNRGRFARQAVLAAIEKREEITPHLLQIMEDTIDRVHEIAEDPSYMSHLYAMILLAQFRESRAYPLIARLFSIPGKVVEDMSGDFITEDLGLVLASVAGGDPGLIKGLIENREAFTWARVGALRAIPAMVGAQELPREEALAYFQDLLRGKLEREPVEDMPDIWNSLVHFAIDLYPEEIYGDIEKAYEARLVESECIAMEDVDRGLAGGKEEVLRALPEKHPLITDAVEEMHGWACFEDDCREWQEQQAKSAKLHAPAPAVSDPPKARAERSPEAAQSSTHRSYRGPAQENPVRFRAVETIVRDTPKLGRNDPCSCGSGKKYKKCCGKAAP